VIMLMEKPNESLVRFITDGRVGGLQYDGEDFYLNGEKFLVIKKFK